MKRAAVCLVGLLVSQRAPCQELVWEARGVVDQYQIGIGVVPVLDANGDGFDDLLSICRPVGAYAELRLFSGRDGSVLRVVPSPELQRYYDRSASAGDWDRDGAGDYAVMIWDGTGQVRDLLVQVRSGRDDRVLAQVQGPWHSLFGSSFLADLDLDGDGWDDLVVVAPRGGGPSQPGQIHAFNHAGQRLYTLTGTASLSYPFGGHTLARIGDVDRDGADDFTVGAYDANAGSTIALLLSGRTGAELQRGLGDTGDFIGGVTEGCGDIDRDGVPDFAAGTDGGPAVGMVRVFSGATGQALQTWRPPVRPYVDTFGRTVASRGLDLDRDGIPDVVLADPGDIQPIRGALNAYSGRDGSLLWSIRGSGSTSMGTSLPLLRPQPGGAFPWVALVETQFVSGGGQVLVTIGKIRMFKAGPTGAQVFGTSCPGTLSTSPQLGLQPRGASGTRIHLSGAPRGAPVALLLGLSRTSYAGVPLPLPLSAVGFPGCELLVSVDLLQPRTAGTIGVDAGHAAVDLPFPLAGTGGAFTLHGQWLVLDTGASFPGGLSDAMSWRH